jgi:hypothetical protein
MKEHLSPSDQSLAGLSVLIRGLNVWRKVHCRDHVYSSTRTPNRTKTSKIHAPIEIVENSGA